MSILDLGFRFDYKIVALLFMWAALISSFFEGFEPSFLTEIFLWISVNCFMWNSTAKGK